MSGKFEVYGAGQSGGEKKSVDWDELNKYVVEQAGLQQRETLTGYVSAIVDLGTQEQPDAEMIFVGDEEDERKAVAEFPNTYFKDGIDFETKKPVRYKCWPQKPVQAVAVAIDFPDIIVDKGKFFGESKPLPLRLWLGGQYYIQGSGMCVQRPTPLKVNKKLGDWSLDQKHLFYKMAVAAKLIEPGQVFVPQRIDQLLGKAFQFEAQVFMKKGTDGKYYYTEYIKFVSGLARGMATPEVVTTPSLIMFNADNDPEQLKEVRNHVINTMKRASNFEGSAIQKQLIEIGRIKEDDVEQKGSSADNASGQAKQEKQTSAQDDFDDDFDDSSLPF